MRTISNGVDLSRLVPASKLFDLDPPLEREKAGPSAGPAGGPSGAAPPARRGRAGNTPAGVKVP